MKMPTLLRKAFKYLPLQAFLQPFCTPVQVPGNAHTRGHRTQPTACRVPSQPAESFDQEQRNNIKQQPTWSKLSSVSTSTPPSFNCSALANTAIPITKTRVTEAISANWKEIRVQMKEKDGFAEVDNSTSYSWNYSSYIVQGSTSRLGASENLWFQPRREFLKTDQGLQAVFFCILRLFQAPSPRLDHLLWSLSN